METEIDFKAIRSKHPLEDVVERKVEPLSANRKVHCPFHQENTPSLHVRLDGTWHCYGCGKGGDVLDFLAYLHEGRKAEGATLFRILDMLGEVGITPLTDEEREVRYEEKRKQRETAKQRVLASREEFFSYSLKAQRNLTEEHRDVFRSWGIGDEWMGRARLGWDGKRLTIPSFFRGVTFGIKRRLLPVLEKLAPPDEPKYISLKGSSPGIYNGDILLSQPSHVIVCEDEKSALAICSGGGVAIASTGGASFWRSQKASWWGRWLGSIPQLYFWRDADEVGVPRWEAGKAYQKGDKVIAPHRGDRFFLKCEEGGQASESFPVGLLEPHSIMEEGGVKWRVCPNPGLQCALDFRAKFPRAEIVDSAPYKDASDALADGIDWREVVTP
jgi:hypothetical protein